jgi:catechol 1,2-dioxygenase
VPTTRRAVVRLLASATAGLALAPGCGPKSGGGGSGGGSGDDGILGAGTGEAGGGSGSAGGVEGDGGGETCDPTATDVQGPYYTAGAPAVAVLAAADEPGTRIRIEGVVVDAADCETPLPGFIVDLWHADDDGEYDNTGFHLRGTVAADASGAFVVETILPGRYSTRPVRHIHFKVWSADRVELLTSQIYFEGDESLNPEVHTGPVVGLDASGNGQMRLVVPNPS